MSALWGYLAEFDDAPQLRAAVRALREAGYTEFEAHTPFPVEGLDKDLGFDDEKVDLLHVVGFIVFGALAVAVMIWTNAVNYPLNVGGRPLIAWPAFVLPAFEIATVGGTIAGVAAMLWLNGLPDRRNPLLAVERFHLASQDKFFISVQASDPLFDQARALLETLGPVAVEEVPP